MTLIGFVLEFSVAMGECLVFNWLACCVAVAIFLSLQTLSSHQQGVISLMIFFFFLNQYVRYIFDSNIMIEKIK